MTRESETEGEFYKTKNILLNFYVDNLNTYRCVGIGIHIGKVDIVHFVLNIVFKQLFSQCIKIILM